MSEQSTNNSSTTAGKGVGDAIKGIFDTGHGAGETLRGTINDTLDSFGKGITRDESGSTQTASGENHASTIEKGKQEFSQGINSLSGAGSKSN